MSRIDELIAELCPNGVEFEPLGKLVNRGSNIRWPEVDGQEFQYIDLTSVDRITHTIGETQTITTEDAPSRAQQVVRTGDVLFGTTRPMLKRYCVVTAAYDGQIASTGYCVLRPRSDRLLTNFLYHLIGTEDFYAYVEANERGASYPAIPDRIVKQFQIPVPPLDVQREIVRILDQFTQLEAELEAELEARRHQFEYYRDLLLRPDGSEIEWLNLKEVSTEFDRGKSKHRPRNDARLYGGPYPFIQTGDIRNSGHLITTYSQTYSEEGLAQSKLWPRGTICITIAANIAETGVLNFEACFPDSVIGMIVDRERSSQWYVEYLLQSLKDELVAKGQGSAQANINLTTFANLRFPFPSLKQQERVVAVLDRFDAILNDLSVGLPAELNARRKQYEYYRNKLLTFKEATA